MIHQLFSKSIFLCLEYPAVKKSTNTGLQSYVTFSKAREALLIVITDQESPEAGTTILQDRELGHNSHSIWGGRRE